MYHHLRGELRELSLTRAVVEAGGVGYDLRIPLSTYDRLKGRKEACLLTHLHVREDDLRLFGFSTAPERDLFRMFLSVSGVGPAIGLAALSALSPLEVARAIAEEDLQTLQRIKGVGRRLAERLAVELRERVAALLPALEGEVGGGRSAESGTRGNSVSAPQAADAVKALVELGYERKAARERVEKAYLQLLESRKATPAAAILSVEELVRRSLSSS